MLARINENQLVTETCLHKARDVIYWPPMSSKVKYFISSCTACSHYLKNNIKELPISHPIPNKPWSRIARDKMNINYSRLLLRLLRIKRTAKRSRLKV